MKEARDMEQDHNLEHGAMHGRGPSDHPEAAGHRGDEHGGDEHGGHAAEHASGHGAHHGAAHGDHARVFRDRFWWTLVLSIPLVFFSEMFQDLLGYTAPEFPGSDWVPPVIGTVIFLYGGWPFLTGAISELRARRPGMMLLIGLAITTAFVASWATRFGTVELDFWWELAALIAVMLLGHWLEMRAVGQASGALEALAALLPDEAERVTEHGVDVVSLGDLEVGDVVLVRSGARVPADGEIIEGATELDESMITGESRPVPKSAGDQVVAGTVATDSAIRVRVTAVGEETALAGIRRLVEEAQQSRSRAQALADRAAAILFYVATATGVITYVVWSVLNQPRSAIERSVTALVIACPHALGLAIPLVISISTALSARNGILVKDRLALERMRQVDVVLFDKTGTLTTGKPAVVDVASSNGSREEILRLAAAVEADSEHPLARAIVAAASKAGQIVRATNFRSLTGRGVEATVGGTEVAVGGPSLMRERSLAIPEDLSAAVKEWQQRGATVLSVVRGETVMGAVALADEIRPESRQAIEELKSLGVEVAMITGDAQEVADAVAAELGIEQVFAQVLPENKDKAVADLQRRAKRVAMVGDGVNDAPALARADVGIAIGAGTDVAIESAGVVLASDDPRAVIDVIRLSRATYRKMIQNLVWATGYNAFALPIAAGALAWAGVTLAPAVGAILMSASTIVVAINAQLLRRLRLGFGRRAERGGS
ncbi:MAG TPA: copper-translocating P-type ATPase [Actinomycetota bacterium]|nr:copper-translocating P-type ATPase [Actinomycetota bacterium]